MLSCLDWLLHADLSMYAWIASACRAEEPTSKVVTTRGQVDGQ